MPKKKNIKKYLRFSKKDRVMAISMKEFFSKITGNNLVIRILSVILAVVLWLFVGYVNPEKEVVYRNITLHIRNDTPENGLAVIDGADKVITVSILAKNIKHMTLNSDNVTAWVDISHIKEPGQYSRSVTVMLPVDDAVIKLITPATLTLTLEEVVNVSVPAVFVNEADLPENYYIKSITPSAVEIKGAISNVEKVDRAEIYIDFMPVEHIITEDVEYVLYDMNNQVVDSKYIARVNDTLSVKVEVYEEKTVPIKIMQENEMFSYTLLETRITVGAPAGSIDDYKEYVINSKELSFNSKGEAEYEITLAGQMELRSEVTKVTIKRVLVAG